METPILQRGPYKYSLKRTGEFFNSVFVQTYTLVSGDWFEEGGAWSLHLTVKDAEEYHNPFLIHCYMKNGNLREAFVSKDTLEAMLKSENKSVYGTWGD